MQHATRFLVASALVLATAAGCNRSNSGNGNSGNGNSGTATTGNSSGSGDVSTTGNGQDTGSGVGTTGQTSGTASTTRSQSAPSIGAESNAGSDFAQFAAMSSMAEIQLGRLAQKQAMSQEVKQFAQRMVTDHTKASTQLKQVAGAPPAPKQLDAKHRDAEQQLSRLNGAAFDRQYMMMMVDDHREAVSRFMSEAGNDTNATSGTGTPSSSGTSGTSSSGTPAGSQASGSSSRSNASSSKSTMTLQDFARQTLPVLQEHLQMAQQIQSGLK